MRTATSKESVVRIAPHTPPTLSDRCQDEPDTCVCGCALRTSWGSPAESTVNRAVTVRGDWTGAGVSSGGGDQGKIFACPSYTIASSTVSGGKVPISVIVRVSPTQDS